MVTERCVFRLLLKELQSVALGAARSSRGGSYSAKSSPDDINCVLDRGSVTIKAMRTPPWKIERAQIAPLIFARLSFGGFDSAAQNIMRPPG